MEEILAANNLPYEREYYDDYYIDLAIPSLKLAIEIQGPTHYVYPRSCLNGRTLNKIRNLKKKG